MALKTILTAATIPALICAASAPSPGQNDAVRIIGGIAALKGDVPFTVSLEKFTGFCFCGGSLLDSSTVLTAAHCVMDLDVDNALVRAGSLYASFGGVTSSLSSIIVHSNYSGLPDFHNDIAILKLAEPIPTEGEIEYPVLAASESDPFSTQVVTSAGWGLIDFDSWTRPLSLRKIQIAIVPRKACNKAYRDSEVTVDMICAGDRDVSLCNGDSGGPLFETDPNILIGIVSMAGRGCAGKPTVFTRVGGFRDFIDEHLDAPAP